MMDEQIALLSGLLIGLVLGIAVLFFIMWRFQRLYDAMVGVLDTIRDVGRRAHTDLLLNSPTNDSKWEEIALARERQTEEMQNTLAELNKAIMVDESYDTKRSGE